MSLETGEKIDGRVVAVLPITDDVINRVEDLGKAQNQPFRASRMLKYEWRPGQAMDVDHNDFDVEEDTNYELLVPAPIEQHMQDPNPFDILAYDDDGNDDEELGDVDNHDNENVAVLPDHFENQGAEEFINEQDDFELHLAEHRAILGAQGAQGAQEMQENQGAQQGAPVREDIKVEDAHDNIKVEDVLDGDEESDDNESDSDSDSEDEPDTRKEERDRRSDHFDIPNNNDYGRGKRRKNPSGHSFLQTSFEDLTKDDRAVFFHHAWNEYKISGKTNLLESFTSGFIFAQLSAKQGIKKYGKEAEIQLLAEFKQLMEYKTFHGRKASDLTYEQKKRAAKPDRRKGQSWAHR